MINVILCDEDGNATGTCEIVAAHVGEGMLHRAFSVFVFRNGGEELLLQRRSAKKMLFPLHWANSCCSHPREGMDLLPCAERRLQEEMGFTCPLTAGPSFVYRAADPEGGGTEHEYDTVLSGDVSDVTVVPNPEEVESYRWIRIEDLIKELDDEPEKFAPWFPMALDHLLSGK